MVTCWDPVNIKFWVRFHHSDLSVYPDPIPKPARVVSCPQDLDVSVQFGEPRLVGIGVHDSF